MDMFQPGQRQRDDDDQHRQPGEQHDLGARAARALGEEQRQQQHGAEFGHRGPGDCELAQVLVELPGVFEDRDDQPERGRRQRHREQERTPDVSDGMEEPSGDDADRHAEEEAGAGEPQQRPAQPVQVQLETGEEEQERQAEQGQHLDRRVDPHPVEDRGADDDAGDDRDHVGRDPGLGREVHQQRCAERDNGDGEQAAEGDVGHGRAPRCAVGVCRVPFRQQQPALCRMTAGMPGAARAVVALPSFNSAISTSRRMTLQRYPSRRRPESRVGAGCSRRAAVCL